MLGEKIGESKGKITNNRVLTPDASGTKVETSFHGTGTLLGIDCNELGTYFAAFQASGALHGEGQGVITTKDGEVVTWRGTGVGKPTGKGSAVNYRGALCYQTTATRFGRLNSTCAIFEYNVDETGNTHGQIWEWK